MSARILIIEDNEENLDLMAYLLRAFGHAPLTVKDGEEGLRVAVEKRPDLILCDIQMPGLDGYEVARRLKNLRAPCRVPLIAVTALAMVGDRDKVLAAGFDGYIAKPITPNTFVEQVEAYLPRIHHSAARIAPVPPPQAVTAPRQPGSTKRATVLVVDDTPANLEFLSSLLEPFGLEVVMQHSVDEGIAHARESPPDLIISDMHMPGRDGLDFVQIVKGDSRLKSIPFIILSSSVHGGGDRDKGLELGASLFICRPIEPQDLLSEIEALLPARATRGDHGKDPDR